MKKEFQKRLLSSIILVPLALFFIIKGSIYFNFFISLLFLISLYEWHYLSLRKIYYLPGIIFITFSFYTFYFFRHEGDYRFFLLILLICVATDIGGYFFGKVLKGPKLTKFSPNKTYAGMFGGFLLSIIFAIIYLNNLPILLLPKSEEDIGIQIILLILSISFISQFGDLVISFFKRKSKIKNTGKIIPGHGGLLDRIDGMIFVFPYIFILFEVV